MVKTTIVSYKIFVEPLKDDTSFLAYCTEILFQVVTLFDLSISPQTLQKRNDKL